MPYCADYLGTEDRQPRHGAYLFVLVHEPEVRLGHRKRRYGWLLAYFGFRANAVQNEQAIQGIKMFLSFLPAVGTVLSVAFISLYPLSEKKMKEITEELEERRRN